MSTSDSPPLWLGLLEPLRAAGEFASLMPAAPLLARAPRGTGGHVLVLPGYTAGDLSTLPLRRFLARTGHVPHGWELGRNLGFGALAHLLDDWFERALDRAGAPVALVGWSLGGVMARRLARRRPEAVRALVTLGSPITGSPARTTVGRAHAALYPRRKEEVEARYRSADLMAPAAGVPTSALYSRSDGVVPWSIARETPGPLVENIEVRASHLGLGVNPAVFYAVADRLAQPAGQWQRFEPPLLLRGVISAGR